MPSLTTNAFNATYQNDTYSWPASPILSTTKTYVGIRGAGNSSNASPLLGPIGLAANGVQVGAVCEGGGWEFSGDEPPGDSGTLGGY